MSNNKPLKIIIDSEEIFIFPLSNESLEIEDEGGLEEALQGEGFVETEPGVFEKPVEG